MFILSPVWDLVSVTNCHYFELDLSKQKLADLSAVPTARLIDGILLTKFDTIDDKVRTSTLVRVVPNSISLCGILIQAQKKKKRAGWSSAFHGLHIWSSSHVRWLWSVLHGPEEAEREIHREDPPEVKCIALNCTAQVCLSLYPQ